MSSLPLLYTVPFLTPLLSYLLPPLSSTHIAALSEPSVLQFPSSVAGARAVMLFNLASIYCLQREVEKARKVLQQVCGWC